MSFGGNMLLSGGDASAFDPEAGLTLSSAKGVAATFGSGFVKSNPTVLACDFTGLNPATDGIIYENGGDGIGASLCVQSGDLVLRGGDGSAALPLSGAASITATCPSGDGTLVWEFANSGVRLWWNGVSLGSHINSYTGNWAGSDGGVYIGAVNNTITSGSPTTAFTGYTTVSTMRQYDNQSV